MAPHHGVQDCYKVGCCNISWVISCSTSCSCVVLKESTRLQTISQKKLSVPKTISNQNLFIKHFYLISYHSSKTSNFSEVICGFSDGICEFVDWIRCHIKFCRQIGKFTNFDQRICIILVMKTSKFPDGICGFPDWICEFADGIQWHVKFFRKIHKFCRQIRNFHSQIHIFHRQISIGE